MAKRKDKDSLGSVKGQNVEIEGKIYKRRVTSISRVNLWTSNAYIGWAKVNNKKYQVKLETDEYLTQWGLYRDLAGAGFPTWHAIIDKETGKPSIAFGGETKRQKLFDGDPEAFDWVDRAVRLKLQRNYRWYDPTRTSYTPLSDFTATDVARDIFDSALGTLEDRLGTAPDVVVTVAGFYLDLPWEAKKARSAVDRSLRKLLKEGTIRHIYTSRRGREVRAYFIPEEQHDEVKEWVFEVKLNREERAEKDAETKRLAEERAAIRKAREGLDQWRADKEANLIKRFKKGYERGQRTREYSPADGFVDLSWHSPEEAKSYERGWRQGYADQKVLEEESEREKVERDKKRHEKWTETHAQLEKVLTTELKRARRSAKRVGSSSESETDIRARMAELAKGETDDE